jgi:hypothetical protein
MNENLYTHGGIEYVPQDVAKDSKDCCTGCAFDYTDTIYSLLCLVAPACGPTERKDGRDIIWVLKDES